MAKITNKKVTAKRSEIKDTEEVVNEVVEQENTIPENDEPQEEVIIQEPVQEEVITTPVQEKKVKIKMAKNHRCCIGGDWYVFKADKEYNVPPNVKEILNKSGLIKPL